MDAEETQGSEFAKTGVASRLFSEDFSSIMKAKFVIFLADLLINTEELFFVFCVGILFLFFIIIIIIIIITTTTTTTIYCLCSATYI